VEAVAFTTPNQRQGKKLQRHVPRWFFPPACAQNKSRPAAALPQKKKPPFGGSGGFAGASFRASKFHQATPFLLLSPLAISARRPALARFPYSFTKMTIGSAKDNSVLLRNRTSVKRAGRESPGASSAWLLK
jgi:hypothetical protein